LENAGYELWVNGKKFQKDLYKKSLSHKSISSKGKGNGILERMKKTILFRKCIQVYRDLKSGHQLNLLLMKCQNAPKSDLIISWIGRNSDIASKLKRSLGIPLISIYDNPLEEEFRNLHGFQPLFNFITVRKERTAIKESSLVILYCKEVFTYLSKKHDIGFNYKIKQFTDDSLMLKQKESGTLVENETINLIYVGSFLPWHNVGDLVLMMQEMKLKNETTMKLHLVGNGMEFEKVAKLVEEGRLMDYVRLYGFMNGKELMELLEKMDIGIIPGCLWFHAPVKYFQYLSAGLIVLAPDTPVLKKLSEDNGSTFFFQDISELKEIILRLKNDRKKITELKLESQRSYKNKYSPQSFVDFWNEQIGSLIK
jgi:glycosyltransferase involved in cell wall biosynthesis